MKWLESFIRDLSPEWAAKREMARYKLQVAMNAHGYEAARSVRRQANWGTSGKSANAETWMALPKLRERSRDLVRNTPYAANAITTLATDIIGTGITPLLDGDANAAARDAWKRFSDTCDFEGHTDFYGLQNLAVRTMKESGEALILKRIVRDYDSPLRLHVLEPDYLDDRKDRQLEGGGYIIQGIEFDKSHQRVAYWLYDRHPGDMSRTATSSRVLARDVIHLYDKLRPGQARGVPIMAPVMLKMKDFDDFETAELVAKQVQACFSVFIQTNDGPENFTTIKNDGTDRLQEVRPGQVTYLKPGEDAKSLAPPVSPGADGYSIRQQRALSVGTGIPYELFTGDLSQVNYSSIKAGLNQYRAKTDQQRYHVVIPILCRKAYGWHATVNQVAGPIPEWQPPAYPAVDAEKEFAATIMAVRAGLMSMQKAVSEQGYNFDEVMREIAEAQARYDELGITVDSDPRKVNRSGSAHNTPQEV